jgi:putative SOS response-associated peptidase YedK
MCSRFSLTSPPEAVRHLFQCGGTDDFPPRYNIAPTEPALILRVNAGAMRELALVRWGLIPSWVKDPREFTTLINARSETASEKPSFRGAMRHRRCLVPTDGFYEWTGRPGAKQPHLIRKMGGGVFALAGLWEHWLGADGSELETMAILTTAANGDVTHLHDRMPVIIAPGHFDRWLDCKPGTADHIGDLLQPQPAGGLETLEVSRKLNNPRADGPDLLEPEVSTIR